MIRFILIKIITYQDFKTPQIFTYELTDEDLPTILNQIPDTKNQHLKRMFLQDQTVTFTTDKAQIELLLLPTLPTLN